jgi:uncharacterized membrane protein YvbJ
MKCRNCGTEIDDSALVCFQCGSQTTESVRQADEMRPRRSNTLTPILLGLVLVVVSVFFIQGAVAGRSIPMPVWVMLIVAGTLLVYRLRSR